MIEQVPERPLPLTRDILADIPDLPLREVEGFGQGRLTDGKNMLILGDNLLALATLLKVGRQVKLVYIDPPFATEQIYKTRTSTVSSSKEDQIAYKDTLVGLDYLDFLEKRLILLRDILAEDGSIYVHMDCHMGHYVKILMDAVFGRDRFINDITRVKCNPKNFKRRASQVDQELHHGDIWLRNIFVLDEEASTEEQPLWEKVGELTRS